MGKAEKDGTVTEYFTSLFDRASEDAGGRPVHTMHASFMGTKFVLTRDPKNIQAILATQFKDFALGEVRHGVFHPLYVRRVIR